MARTTHWDSHPDLSGTVYELKTPDRYHSYDLLAHMWVSKDKQNATIENFRVPHVLGPVHLRAVFKNGEISRVSTTSPSKIDLVKLKLGGKRALVKHLKSLLEKHPNAEVEKAVGLNADAIEDVDEYHAGEIQEPTESKGVWSPDGLRSAHNYSANFVRLNTIHTGSDLQISGILAYDDVAHPVDFSIYKNGEIEGIGHTSYLLFPRKDNARAKYFRSALKKALSTHPHADEFKLGLSKF